MLELRSVAVTRALVALVALAAAACGSEAPPLDKKPPPRACVPGELTLDDGRCQPAGLPLDLACPPGESAVGEACVAAGVTIDDCAHGFSFDGAAGCTAILPREPCGPGTLALPGQTTCVELMPCGTDPWNGIPIDATTQFVDAAYAGSDSDGGQAKPWTTIQLGVEHAEPGGLVAIAAGSYAENVTITGTPVRLWGRCPKLVELVAAGTTKAAVQIASAAGTALRGLSIAGADAGVAVSDSDSVLLEHVWIHDTADRGLVAVDTLGPARVVVRDSLVESATDVAVFLDGAQADIEGAVLRGTLAKGPIAAGIAAQASKSGRPSSLSLKSSIVERGEGMGILVGASEATIEASVVRDTLPAPDGTYGRGVEISDGPGAARSKAHLVSSVIERSRSAGLRVVGSDVDLEGTVVRDTSPGPGGTFGRGIDLETSPAGGPTVATITRSLVARNHEVGLVVIGAELTLAASRVEDTQATAEGGIGVQIQDHPTGVRSTATIETSVVGGNAGVGVYVLGSDAVLDRTVVRDTLAVGSDARGVFVSLDAATGQRGQGTIRASVLERNAVIGLLVLASDAVVESSVIRDSQPNESGEARGIGIEADLMRAERASASIKALLVEHSRTMGLYVGGADVTVESSVLRDALARGDGKFGDGITVVGSESIPSTVGITATLVEQSARASLSNFGSTIDFGSSNFACGAFELEGEVFLGSSFEYRHEGGGRCGCPVADGDCQVLSSGLAAPDPSPP